MSETDPKPLPDLYGDDGAVKTVLGVGMVALSTEREKTKADRLLYVDAARLAKAQVDVADLARINAELSRRAQTVERELAETKGELEGLKQYLESLDTTGDYSAEYVTLENMLCEEVGYAKEAASDGYPDVHAKTLDALRTALAVIRGEHIMRHKLTTAERERDAYRQRLAAYTQEMTPKEIARIRRLAGLKGEA